MNRLGALTAPFIAVLGFALVPSSVVSQQKSQEVLVVAVPSHGNHVTCDNTARICKTNIVEVHQDHAGDTRYKALYEAPAGVTFTGEPRGVELEAGGADHHVHAYSEGLQHFSCEWYARKRPGGDNGLAKGYCERGF